MVVGCFRCWNDNVASCLIGTGLTAQWVSLLGIMALLKTGNLVWSSGPGLLFKASCDSPKTASSRAWPFDFQRSGAGNNWRRHTRAWSWRMCMVLSVSYSMSQIRPPREASWCLDLAHHHYIHGQSPEPGWRNCRWVKDHLYPLLTAVVGWREAMGNHLCYTVEGGLVGPALVD